MAWSTYNNVIIYIDNIYILPIYIYYTAIAVNPLSADKYRLKFAWAKIP